MPATFDFGFSQSDTSTCMYICNCHSHQCILHFPFLQALQIRKVLVHHGWVRKCDKLDRLASHSKSWCLTNYDDIFHNLRHHYYHFAAGKYHSLCGHNKHQIPAAIHQLVLYPLPGSFWSDNNLSVDAVWIGADHYIRALDARWDHVQYMDDNILKRVSL